VADLRHEQTLQRGSTITQQYVKNAYTNKQRTLVRKVREAVLASQLDRQTPKDEILFRYLDGIYLGDGAYGVGAASASYFRKSVKDLTLSESAMLAGLVPAPTRWAPRENPDDAEIRRELVLNKMLQQHRITQQQYDQAFAQKLWLLAKGNPPGPATVVYPQEQDFRKYPDFVDYVEKWLNTKFPPSTIYRGGLKIYTSIDPDTQDAASASIQNALKGTGEPLEMGMAAVEPATGLVKAMVGGRAFGSGQYAST